MSMSKLSIKCMSLAFALMSSGIAARADQTVVIPMPVTEETTTIETELVPVVTTPSVSETTTTTTTETQKIISTSPSVRTVEKTLLTGKWSGMPNFKGRLRLMEEQIKEGVDKGLISQVQADILLSEHARVARMEQDLPLFTISRAQGDDMERQLNALNISIHRTMELRQVAGTGRLQ